jgi:hypothetical protein
MRPSDKGSSNINNKRSNNNNLYVMFLLLEAREEY